MTNDANIFYVFNYPTYIVHTSVNFFKHSIEIGSKNLFLFTKGYESMKNV